MAKNTGKNKQEKINRLARNFHLFLLKMAIEGLRKDFHLTPKEIPAEKLRQFLRDITSTQQINYISLADSFYYVIPWSQFKEILDSLRDFLKKIPYIKEKMDCYVPSELAWSWGLFFADGSCGLGKKGYGGAFWRIVNTNLTYLKRAKRAFEKYYPNLEFPIRLYPSYRKGNKTNYGARTKNTYCLEVKPKREGRREPHKKYINGGQKERGKFIEKYINYFYWLGKKRVPKPIFDKYYYPRKSFLKGVIAGDGTKTLSNNYISIGRDNPMAEAMLSWLMYSLKWKQRTQITPREFKLYFKDTGLRASECQCACDDFAYLFSSLVSWIFHLNTCGVVHGRVNIGHFWNAIIAEKEGKLKLFYYDVKKGGYTEYEKGRPIIIGNWSYTPDSYRFF